MTSLILFVVAMMIISELTQSINDPKEKLARAQLIKFQPEWTHIHNCDEGC